MITDIFPIGINYLKITDGTLRYVNHASSNPQVDIRVEHMLSDRDGPAQSRGNETTRMNCPPRASACGV